MYNIEDPQNWVVEKKWKAHSGYILKCAYSPNGRYVVVLSRQIGRFLSARLLATSASDGTVKIWDVESDYKLDQLLQGHQVRTRYTFTGVIFVIHSLYLTTVALGLGPCLCIEIQLLGQRQL